jgi:hypothetical protein
MADLRIVCINEIKAVEGRRLADMGHLGERLARDGWVLPGAAMGMIFVTHHTVVAVFVGWKFLSSPGVQLRSEERTRQPVVGSGSSTPAFRELRESKGGCRCAKQLRGGRAR